ncbi:MAG: ABC transporter permease [Thermoprotei archaeon]
MKLSRILADFTVFRREYLRNRVGLFFALIFPIILILLFGAIFSTSGGGAVPLHVQDLDSGPLGPAFVQALNKTGAVNVVEVSSSANMSQYMLSHSYSEGLVIPSGFSTSIEDGRPVNVTLYTDPADSSTGIVVGVVQGVVSQFNLRIARVSPSIGYEDRPVNSQAPKYIDFLVPGLIGFSILTSPMFSLVNISAEYKKSKFFKQLSLTPLTKGEWLTSKILWYVSLSALSFVLMVLFGVGVFGADVRLSLLIVPAIVLGPLLFVSLGMLVGTVTKTQESAGVVGNIITFPMMFLSGTFFPLSIMPTYLQDLAHVFPLFYVVQELNDVMVYNNPTQAVQDLVVLLALSVVLFVAAVRLFKWRED